MKKKDANTCQVCRGHYDDDEEAKGRLDVKKGAAGGSIIIGE